MGGRLKGSAAHEISENLLQQPGYASVYQQYLLQVCGPNEARKQTAQMVEQSVTDQVRNFTFLSYFLSTPCELATQTAFHLPTETTEKLMEVFYELEEVVARELLGSKFKLTGRKGLDTLIERTKRPPQVGKRVYDNLRNVYALVTKANEGTMGLVETVSHEFHVSRELAESYVGVVFLCLHRFETSKKRLQVLRYKDFLHIAKVMLLTWCCPSPLANLSATNSLSIDKNLAESLRNLKQLFTREVVEEYKQLVLTEFGKSNPADRTTRVEKELTAFLKALMVLSVTLGQKELKDFFVTLVEKLRVLVVDRMELRRNGIRALCNVIIACFDPLSIPNDVKADSSNHWATFVSGISECLNLTHPPSS